MSATVPPLPDLISDLPESWSSASPSVDGLVDEPLRELLAALPSSDLRVALPPGVHLAGDGVHIAAGSRIQPGSTLEGPLRIGNDCTINTGAVLCGGAWLGSGCTVGISASLERSFLGSEVTIGAGARVRGAVLGDGVCVGENAVIDPGTVVGARTRLGPGVHLTAGLYPGDHKIERRADAEMRPTADA